MSGLYNWVFTIGYGFATGFIYESDSNQISEIYTQSMVIYDGQVSENDSFECETLGFAFGKLLAVSLEARTDSDVYFNEVLKYSD